jgi:DNA-binding CsgD family transcriptional regulator/pimeloyl-ACP methyl ester carboxylesterase
MEPPAVQYVKTDDGFNIAYTVTGDGIPFVFMPWPFSHRGLWWQTAFGRPIAEALAARYHLIQYDSRGQGMSTRGLPEYHTLDDYRSDLEAVIGQLGLERFVLYGGPIFCNVAVRYAVQHPERVMALVLGEVALDATAFGGGAYSELARRDWDFFLHTMVASFSLEGAPRELEYWRDSIDRDDWLKMAASAGELRFAALLSEIRVPTLVLNVRRLAPGEAVAALADHGQAVAGLIPGARLILFDGWASIWYSDGSGPPAAISAIEEFLNSIPSPASSRVSAIAIPVRLSPREIEVLRLVADGRTNREIAEALVISERTVINHLSNIFTKTGAENRAGAATHALRHGLV